MTGGAGFIGSHIVDACLAVGHEVAVVDDLSTVREENLNPHARFYRADIRDAAAVEQVLARERPELTGLSTTFRANSVQLRAEVDREKATLLAVPVTDVYSAIQAQLEPPHLPFSKRKRGTCRLFINRTHTGVVISPFPSKMNATP